MNYFKQGQDVKVINTAVFSRYWNPGDTLTLGPYNEDLDDLWEVTHVNNESLPKKQWICNHSIGELDE